MYQKHPKTQIYLSSCTTEVKIAPKTREALRFLAFGLNFHAISASDRFNFLCWSIVVKVRNSEGIVSPIFWLQKDDLDCLGSCFTTISTIAGDVKSYLYLEVRRRDAGCEEAKLQGSAFLRHVRVSAGDGFVHGKSKYGITGSTSFGLYHYMSLYKKNSHFLNGDVCLPESTET